MTATTTIVVPAAPACVDWCEVTHDGEQGWDDVRSRPRVGVEADKRCRAAFATVDLEGRSVQVSAERFVYFGEDAMDICDPEVRIGDDTCSPEQAISLARVLRQAAQVATSEAGGRLLTVEEAAEKIDVPAATLVAWRYAAQGPRSFLLGRRVVYRSADLEKWAAENEHPTAP
jgi:hypothetical protein